MSTGKGGKPSGVTTTNTTTSSAPWAPQQPYLTEAFGGAQNLYQNYTPQYYPNSTYAAPNPYENQALQSTWDLANAFLSGAAPTMQNALDTNNFFTTGQSLWANPALAPLASLGGANLGQNNAGTGVLNNLANSPAGTLYDYMPSAIQLGLLSGQNAANLNPALGTLTGLANQGVPGLGGAEGLATSSIAPSQGLLGAGLSPAMSTLGGLSGTNFGLANPGTGTLAQYASGADVGNNPFTQGEAQSVLANVLPSIQNQFIQGGGLSSPQAAYASSQGATAALAPVLFNQYTQEQQLQQQAAQALAQNTLAGAGLQGAQAGALGNLGISGAGALQNTMLAPSQLLGSQLLGGAGLQAGVGENLGAQQLQGQGLQQSGWQNMLANALGLGGLQQSAAATLGSQALQGQGLQQGALERLGGLYDTGTQQQLAAIGQAPGLMQSMLGLPQAQFGAGQQQQQFSQQALNDLVNRWNYQQQLPYTQLNQYLQNIGGSYGGVGTGSSSQPYYTNPFANALTGALGVGTLGNQLGLGGALGGLFGGGGASAMPDLATLAGAGGGGLFDFGAGGAAAGALAAAGPAAAAGGSLSAADLASFLLPALLF